MTTGHDLIIDQPSPTAEGPTRLMTWYAQGHSDGLGDRLLMFDNTSAPSWEILRFRQWLARDPQFESALRQRVERLSSFHHPAFPVVRPIRELDHEDGLAVVSTHVSGAYLSEALKKPRSATFASRLIRQLVPALAALQQHAPGMAHGALTPGRIVLTSEGRLMIREHMVGSAIKTLRLPAARLWSDFGVVEPPTPDLPAPALDQGSDVAQLAFVALSLMAGRLIGPDEYPAGVRELLDQLSERSRLREAAVFEPLRRWLERALRLEDRIFESAREASDALAELWDEPQRGDGHDRAPHLVPWQRTARNEPSPAPTGTAAAAPPEAHEEQSGAAGPAPRSARQRGSRSIRWAAAAVGVLAVGEAAFIGRMLYQRSGGRPAVASTAPTAQPQPLADAAETGQRGQVAPDLPDARPPVQSSGVLPAIVVADAEKASDVEAAAGVNTASAPAASQRSGGFRVSAPVEVHVLDGERVLGSSLEGPIIAPAGRREFEFVNSVIGYRLRRVVDVRPGQITTLSIPVPNGTLNINAVPWAEVWIDGRPFGETPLGNLSVPPGEHEIVFRHPRLGERREKTIVRADSKSRVAVNLQQ